MITEQLAEVLGSRNICPHFHIAVQTGSDLLVKSIKSNYLSNRVREAVELLRKSKKDPFIAADVIVGLPGETDNEFLKTKELLEELSFSKLHVFPFSPRPGTSLFSAGNRIPERIAGKRAEILRNLSEKLYQDYLDRWEDCEVEIILEKKTTEGLWFGFSQNYIKVKVFGLEEAPDSDKISGRLRKALIVKDNDSKGSASARFIRFL